MTSFNAQQSDFESSERDIDFESEIGRGNRTIDEQLSDISDDDNDEQLTEMSEQTDEFNKVVQALAQSFGDTEKTGSAINKQLAKIVNEAFRSFPTKELVTEWEDKYPRPENCAKMTVPKLNEEVYNSLNNHREAQYRDRRLQSAQQLIINAAVPIIQIMQLIGERKGSFDFQKCLQLAGDSLCLTSAVFTGLALRRRDFIKPYLSNQYRKLCSTQNPLTSELFGDDLAKQIRDINDTKKVNILKSSQFLPSQKRSFPFSQTKPRTNYTKPPFKRSATVSNKSRPFLSQAPLPYVRENNKNKQRKH